MPKLVVYRFQLIDVQRNGGARLKFSRRRLFQPMFHAACRQLGSGQRVGVGIPAPMMRFVTSTAC